MPIYEFACPKCRVIFNFLSKRINPEHLPQCPKCGNKKMLKQVSAFALPRGAKEPTEGAPEGAEGPPMPDMDERKLMRAMGEMERDMAHLDENNPKHLGRMMRKMQDMFPAHAMPRELEVAIKRLEAGEDPDKIEADMGDVLGDFMGGTDADADPGNSKGSYTKDSGLYDY